MTDREQFEAWAIGRKMTLCKVTPCNGDEPRYDDCCSKAAWGAWQAARRAEPEQAEPVAWMITDDFPSVSMSEKVVEDWRQSGKQVIPLYTAPQRSEQE